MASLKEAIAETNLDGHPTLVMEDAEIVRAILFGLTRFRFTATAEQAQQAVDALSALTISWREHPDQLAAFIARHQLEVE